MKCPYCASDELKVLDKRDVDSGEAIKRRRECAGCGKRFTTYEKPDVFLTIIKKDGKKEAYDRLKILNGVIKACEKRPIPQDAINLIVDEVESEVFNKDTIEIPSRTIGSIVMKKLMKLDKVAYLRFASVYREFDDVNLFAEEIEKLARA